MAIDINIPSQVKTYANLAAFPATGSLKTIFIAEDTNKTYRWTGTAYVEVSAAGATGITIGTTAITSGAVGRVLFEGTGNVVQESANLTWDNTNSRLALNGTLGKLMFPSPEISFSSRFNGIHFTDSTYATSYGYLSLSSGFGEFRMFAGSSYFPTFYSNGAERMRIFTTGNIGINTTTDAGFKLDVNGTARVSGNVTVSGNTTITGSFIANSAGTGYEGFKIQDGGTARFVAERLVTNFLGIGHNSSAGRWDDVILGASQRLYFYTGASERARFAVTTGNFLIGTTTDAGYKLDVNGTARFTGNVFLPTDILIGSGQSTSVWNRIMLYDVTNGSINITMHNPAWYIRHNANMSMDGAMQVGSNTSAVASAVLQATSTTKGFLPPRMTQAQRNAIASPATGLMVYDTTLNRPCFYDGTTWITL